MEPAPAKALTPALVPALVPALSRPRVEGTRVAEIQDATLHRRWHVKNQLVIDALINQDPHFNDMQSGTTDAGSLRGDLVAVYCGPDGLTYQPGDWLEFG